MLKSVHSREELAKAQVAFDVEIASLATAVPAHKFTQVEAVERAKLLFPHLKHLDTVFANTGIETRYSCVPLDWYRVPHHWEDRTETFQKHAVDLMEEVARRAIADAGLSPQDISAIVTNTITGLAIPSLDAKLMNRLELPDDCERLPIFGLGCAGGVAGLSRATRQAQSMPGGHVLFITVELCGLCFRHSDQSKTMFVASALFADGAAALVLSNTSTGTEPAQSKGRIVAVGDHFWRGTEHIMGWSVENDGFGIVLSTKLPQLIREKLGPALDGFLAKHNLRRDDLNGYVFHPGGGKILKTAEETLGFTDGELEQSWNVLRDFGNMSSSTVLFILQKTLALETAEGLHLMVAFGPGFSATFVLVDF